MANRIVFVDNNQAFLKTRKEFLELRGLEVIPATTLEEAEFELARTDIDLAILDIRMSNDDDDKDISGFQLAADPRFHAIPKIILTGYFDKAQMDGVFANHLGDLPRFIEFVTKQEGPGVMLAAISRVLSLRASLNYHRTEVSPKIEDEDRRVSTNSNEVFIIHGHDEAARDSVARCIEKAGLKAVILKEKANEGGSLLEKLEKYGAVDFAVAILTPDDIGKLKSDTGNPNDRARQNVIFELGYFIGRLGKAKVCALVKDDPEIPSDYVGIMNLRMDSQDLWKWLLLRELTQTGLSVDHKKFYE